MKKFLGLVFTMVLVVMVTGCGTNSNSGTLTCTMSETDEDGYVTDYTTIVTYEDDIVTKVEQTTISEMDSDYIELSVSLSQAFAEAFNQIDGMNVSVEQTSDTAYKTIITIDYTTIDIDAIKELYGDDFDEEYYSANQDLDTFKANNLDGYTCK